MNKLTELLTKGLLEDEKRTVAVYGGGFKPPTAGHFEVVDTAIKKNPNIDKFIILIGGKERDGVTPEESILIWDIYKQYLPVNVEVKLSPKPPIQAVYNYAKEHPDEDVIFVIGAREGNENDFADIAKRTKSVDNYPNLRVETVVTQGGASGTAARNAAKVSVEKLRPLLPQQLKDEEVEEIYGYIVDVIQEGRKKKKDPKKGTGKKPKKSGRRLYTDEDPKDTVGIKFSTRQDIVDTLNKKSFKAKSHARQSQIINLIHQRVRAAYGRAKNPAVKKRLKSGLDYITKKKEASKKKTQRLKDQKENIDPKSQAKHKGKSAPFGSAYEPVNENATYSSKIDYKQQIKDLTKHMIKKGMNILPLPKVIFKHGDQENASQFLGKTAYYDPNNMAVVLYTEGRHPKDIARSFAHEMIHHIQNLEGRLENISTTNTMEDDHLNDIEREAYTKGNMTFRNWTDSKDGEEVTSLNEIGDASSKVFSYKKKEGIDAKPFKEITDDNEDGIQAKNIYEFETDLGTKYVVDIEVEYDPGDMYVSPVLDADINFTTLTKGGDIDTKMASTNKGEQYAVMATISDIMINWINEWDKYFYINSIWIEPKVEDDESGDAIYSQRGRLYKIYLDKQLSRLNKSYKLKQHPQAFKIVPTFKNLKETKKQKDPFGLNQYARELVKETFSKTVTIDMSPIIKALEFEMPTGQETDENVIAIIDAAPQGKVPHPVFLDFYAKFDKYFGEENDNRMLDNFGLEYLLSNVLNLPNEDIQIVMNHYNTTDQDSVEWFEQHDNELEKDEEYTIPEFNDSRDDYDTVINYRKKQLSKSLEEQNKVRIFNKNCNCDKT